MSDHKSKFTNGVLWNFIDTLSIQGVSFIVSIILARILSPSDFGIVAIVNVFVGVALVFTNSGLSEALIVKKDFSENTLRSVFSYNIAVSLFLYCIIFFLAPYVADFYKIEALTSIIRVLTCTLLISNSNNVHLALLYNDINFKKMFVLKLPGIVAGACLGIFLAILNYGVWALVWQTLLNALLNSLILWIIMWEKFRPSLYWDLKAMKNLFSFSGKFVITGGITILFEGFYPLFIGKKFSAQNLAYYNRGVSLKDIIIGSIVKVIAKVSFPVLSKLTGDKVQLKRVYSKILQVTFYIIAPIMLGGIAVSYNLIYTLYSSKWIFAVPYFKLACVIGLLQTFHYIVLDVLKVYSEAALFLKLEILNKFLLICSLFITYHYGVETIMVGQIIVSIICLFINSYFTGKILSYSIFNQFKDLNAVFLLSGSMGIIVYFVGYINLSPPMLLFIQIFTGVIVYITLSFVFKIEAFTSVYEMLKAKIK